MKIATGPSLPMSATDMPLGSGLAAALARMDGSFRKLPPRCMFNSRNTTSLSRNGVTVPWIDTAVYIALLKSPVSPIP